MGIVSRIESMFGFRRSSYPQIVYNPKASIVDEFDNDRICVFENIFPNDLLEKGKTILIDKRRNSTDPYAPSAEDMSKEEGKVRKAFEKEVLAWAERLFPELFPGWSYSEVVCAIRPFITQNEVMHYDNTETDPSVTLITFFINFDNEMPRKYRFGMSFAAAKEKYPADFQELKHLKSNIGRAIRYRTAENKGPINSKFPTEDFDLMPGWMAVFNPKNVAHEIIFGRGVAMITFATTDSKARSQLDILAEC